MVYLYGLITYIVMAYILWFLILPILSKIYASPTSPYRSPFIENIIDYLINGNVTYQVMLYFAERKDDVNVLYLFVPVLIASLINQFNHYSQTRSIYRLGILHGSITGVILLATQYFIWG